MTTSLDSRLWPSELEAYKFNPKAIPLQSGDYYRECPNCGGHGALMIYLIESGPYRFPLDGGKSKWLDLEPDPAMPERPCAPGWYTGKIISAHCPVCRQGRMDAYLEHNCGLWGNDLAVTLGNFRPLAGKEAALQTARELLAMNTQPAGFVTFHGGYGMGKSHMLKALVNGFRMVKVRARYATLPDLLGLIREKFGNDAGVIAVEDALDAFSDIPVLAIDEIADGRRASMTAWAQETTFRLLDRRYNKSAEKLTILATNVNPSQMAPEWGYLKSRMDGGKVVEVAGEDMRQYNELLRQQKYTRRPMPIEEPEDETPINPQVGNAINDLVQSKTTMEIPF